MATVRKTILVPGKHVSPDGVIVSTPERNRAYVDKFQKCKAKGIKFPVCWGHDKNAIPDNHAFLSSRLNAGYLEDLVYGPNGEVDAVIDCPGLKLDGNNLVGVAQLDGGQVVPTAISEVSPGIFNKYRDGQGEVHEDIIGHLALTPLPVQLNQSGFTGLATDSQDDDFEVIYLGTKNDDADDDLGADLKRAASTDADGATDGPDAGKPTDSPFSATPAPVDPNVERVQQLIMDLNGVGCPLPADTDVTNFVERFAIAFSVLKAQMAKQQATAQADSDAANKPSQSAPIREEQNPSSSMMMMSTRIDTDPMLRSILAEELENKSTARLERIETMRRRGLKGHIADALKKSADLVKPDVVRLSSVIDEHGQRRKLQVDTMLDYLDEQLPREEFAATYLSTIAPTAIKESVSPLDQSQATARIGTIEMTPEQKADIEASMARIGM